MFGVVFSADTGFLDINLRGSHLKSFSGLLSLESERLSFAIQPPKAKLDYRFIIKSVHSVHIYYIFIIDKQTEKRIFLFYI